MASITYDDGLKALARHLHEAQAIYDLPIRSKDGSVSGEYPAAAEFWSRIKKPFTPEQIRLFGGAGKLFSSPAKRC